MMKSGTRKTASIFLIIVSVAVLSTNVKAEVDDDPSWDKAQWILEAFDAIRRGDYPLVRAVSYWHERWMEYDGTITNLRIDSSDESLRAYKTGIDNLVFVTNPVFSGNKLLPPRGNSVYHAAFPDFGSTEDHVSAQRIKEFESLSGKEIVWAYFSNNWIDGKIIFPATEIATIHNAGRVPFIRMMMRSQFDTARDPIFTLKKIIDGSYDSDLTAWFTAAKSAGYPLLVEFGTEVNGDRFPWNGRWNGGSTVGPARFVKAYRHLVELYRAAPGADTVTWFYHVDASSSPEEDWNSIEAYYPGDKYVDWIGVSVYGPQRPDEDYESFVSIMDRVYPRLAAIAAPGNKPIAILEMGISEP